jgi:preprotein translocase subunit YajC
MTPKEIEETTVGEDNLLGTLFPLLLIVLAFWLLVIRPAKKRQQDMSRIQNSVTIGSEVMLGSGFYGTVVGVGDDTLQLSIAPGTEVKVARQAVVRVVDGTTADVDDRPTDRPEQP